MQRKHFFISGRVQGVFYRDSTQKKAIELGLTGWVKNLPDGRVECKAFGTEEQLTLFTEWLWQGPPAAEVSDIQIDNTEIENIASFEVRR